jgi:hypothetical protein
MKRASLTDVLPLSPLQEGLLFHSQYDHVHSQYDHGAPDVYAVQLIVELAGEVDAADLRASGKALLARHASLRACFRFRKTGVDGPLLWRRNSLRLPPRTKSLSMWFSCPDKIAITRRARACPAWTS